MGGGVEGGTFRGFFWVTWGIFFFVFKDLGLGFQGLME
jgi:TM2 domain-containing membrane protein YozV